ncbi:hypothetical protein PR048_011430 [Dryococelus australis]|uniref:Uncharacterized protein n=1 Tax=Dryococelus australis TaxID=614101 RepID=A0ABQ9HM54_9NEOP|nr:hypothetical protein PR048_011430 [Dryococelus australis]
MLAVDISHIGKARLEKCDLRNGISRAGANTAGEADVCEIASNPPSMVDGSVTSLPPPPHSPPPKRRDNAASVAMALCDISTLIGYGKIPNRNAILRRMQAFRITGSVMKKKTICRYPSVQTTENIDRVREVILASPFCYARCQASALGMSNRLKVTVLCTVVKFGIIGPFYLEEVDMAVTVTSACYIEMLNTFMKPELHRHEVNISHVWFQQDGATAQTAFFGTSSPSMLSPISAMSRESLAPPINPCDFFVGLPQVYSVCKKAAHH